MAAKAKQVEEQYKVKRYKAQYPISAYIFPHEAHIDQVHFDDEHVHVTLQMGGLFLYHYSGSRRSTTRLPRSAKSTRSTQAGRC